MLIGNNGALLRNIIIENCIKKGDNTTKIRLRGKGSGHKEGKDKEESKDPMELCISSLNFMSFITCSSLIESLLFKIYYQFYIFQCQKYKERAEKNQGKTTDLELPVMKKILKYQYTVNRYNTLAKEEKKRRLEESQRRRDQY